MDKLASTAMPGQIARAAHRYGCDSVAYTYNDPVIFLEYAIDTAQACHELGIKSVAVSAGYICDQPRQDFYRHMDAANIDLKGFTNQFYKKLCHSELQPVLDTLLYLKRETSTWFEITTLLIPGENDSDQELHALSQWIAENLGPNIPLHFSAFHPDFKMMDIPATPVETLLRARDIALSYGLHYVYCGNVHHQASDTTYCPHCHKPVITRDWYQLGSVNVDANGCCQHCQGKIAGRFGSDKKRFGRRRIPVQINPSVF